MSGVAAGRGPGRRPRAQAGDVVFIDLDADVQPVQVAEHTVFPIASISKTFAATMAVRLVEQGKLDLKASVRKYLPDFRVPDEAASHEITIRHLLTHTAGWEGQISGPERGEDTLRNFVANVLSSNMQVAPPDVARLFADSDRIATF